MNNFKLTLEQPTWWRTHYGEWQDMAEELCSKVELPNEPVFVGLKLKRIYGQDVLKQYATIILDRIGIVSLERVKELRCVEDYAYSI